MTENNEKRYQIVVRADIGDLKERVNELMREGWMPTGGVAVMPEYGYECGETCFISNSWVRCVYHGQAMVLPQKRCTTTCAFDEEVSLMFAGSAA